MENNYTGAETRRYGTLSWKMDCGLNLKCSHFARGKSPGGIGDIYYSKLVNGVYEKPVSIGSEINTPALEN